MPAMPVPPQSAAPRPDAEGGLLPSLYAVALGPLNASYYQTRFAHYEALGRSLPQWNHGAAFCTLGWLGLRRLWRPAAAYLVVLALLWALGWMLVHHLPQAIAWAGVLLLAVLACVVPGLMGTALYYRAVRRHTLQTLQQSRTLAQTRSQLALWAITPERLHTAAATQVALCLLVAAALFFGTREPAAPSLSSPPLAVVPEAPSAPVTPPAPLPAAAEPAAAEPATEPPVQASPPPAPTPAPAAATALLPGQFYVNSGLFHDAAHAELAEHRLRAAGLTVWSQPLQTQQGTATRVRVGPFASRAKAEAAARRIARMKLETQVFQQPETPAPAAAGTAPGPTEALPLAPQSQQKP